MTVSTAGQASGLPIEVNSAAHPPRHGQLPRTIATFLLLAGLVLAPPSALAQDFTVGAGQTVGQQVMNSVGDKG